MVDRGYPLNIAVSGPSADQGLTAPEAIGDNAFSWGLQARPAFGPRSWSYQGRQDVSLRLCRAVLRVDVVLAQKITEPLDLIAQGWEGGPR